MCGIVQTAGDADEIDFHIAKNQPKQRDITSILQCTLIFQLNEIQSKQMRWRLPEPGVFALRMSKTMVWALIVSKPLEKRWKNKMKTGEEGQSVSKRYRVVVTFYFARKKQEIHFL